MPKALGRLRTILRRGLDATASLWPEVRVAYGWVHRAAHILNNDTQDTGAAVKRRLQGLLGAMVHHQAKAGALAPAGGHFLKVSRSDWLGLFHCYNVPDLPRTNNELEQFFGAYRCHERRATGRKVASPAVVLRGAVRLVACAATRIRPFTSEALAPDTVSTWQELRHALETRHQQRTQRRRFRRDPATYLGKLEAKLLQLSLPPWKKTLALITAITQKCSHRTTVLARPAQALHQELKKVMRGFGRQCRGRSHVLVPVVRHTEQTLLQLGEPITALGQQAPAILAQAMTLSDAQRPRVAEALNAALSSHARLRKQSTRLIHSQKPRHCKLVNAYDLTIAPILKGKSNGPAQFGRKPGIASEPATGFIFANHVPAGNPSDPSDVFPLLDKVQSALDRLRAPKPLHVHAVAGDLGINDTALRQALHARGILTIGIPKTVEPINAPPTAKEIRNSLNEAGLNRRRTPYYVQLACACGYSRPVVESHIASLLSHGAGQLRYKGLLGAVVQQGMTVMTHNGAVLVRLRQQQVSKRAQKFRRLLGLKPPKANEINHPKN